MLLIGLDFGSTTSSALVARARAVRNCVTGQMELTELSTVFRAEPVLTPFVGRDLDEPRLAAHLDEWLMASGVEPHDFEAGGAIVTGLAARAGNAAGIKRLVRQRLGNALVATADDPCLESWLAFMGNCLSLSRAEPQTPTINLDIGGGTTNLAWGLAGEVQGVGCYYIGARHLRFESGSYRLAGRSEFGELVMAGLGIQRQIGDEWLPSEVNAVLDFYVHTLEAAVSGEALVSHVDLARQHLQVAFKPPTKGRPVVCFSGGVGELVYRQARGEPLPPTTAYGDLGIDLARRLCQSPMLAADLQLHQPEQLGRATVYGLAVHNTQLSGATLHLPRPNLLPLSDLPIVGRIVWDAATIESASPDPGCSPNAPSAGVFACPTLPSMVHDQLRAAIELAARANGGACLAIECSDDSWRSVKLLGELLAETLQTVGFPAERPLVLLVSANIGKTLGQYATRWGRLPVELIVLDEIASRAANFVSLGALSSNSIPVSFYGWQPADTPE